MSKSKNVDAVKFKAGATYELTMPFYDNLVLHDTGSVITFEDPTSPDPSMIPLNKAAAENLELWHTARGEEYVPPLSELPDTLDGQVTVKFFNPGDRKNTRRSENKPPFPVTPGKHGNKRIGAATAVALENLEIPQLPPKNFNRAPR